MVGVRCRVGVEGGSKLAGSMGTFAGLAVITRPGQVRRAVDTLSRIERTVLLPRLASSRNVYLRYDSSKIVSSPATSMIARKLHNNSCSLGMSSVNYWDLKDDEVIAHRKYSSHNPRFHRHYENAHVRCQIRA